jgi:hypothetical protein
LFENFMHTHPHYIFASFPTWGSHSHFVGIRYTIKGPIGPLGGALFALTHLCTFHIVTTTHPTYVYLYLVDDTHIVGPTSNVVCCIFMSVRGVINIKSFSAANEMCNLVSSKVGPLYITSS